MDTSATRMPTGTPHRSGTDADTSPGPATTTPRDDRWAEPLGASANARQTSGGSRSPTTARAVRALPEVRQVPNLDTQRRERLESMAEEHPEFLAIVNDMLARARQVVNEFERWQRTAQPILTRSQRQALNDADFCRLYRLHLKGTDNFEFFQSALTEALSELARTEALIATDANLVFEFQRRFDDVRDFSLRFVAPWRRVAKRVDTVLPVGSGEPVAVELFASPGQSIKALVPGIYLPDSRPTDFSVVRYYTPPALELSGIGNASGQMLFTAVRHGFFHAHEISGDLLATQADDDALRSVLQFHRIRELQTTLPMPQDTRTLVSRSAEAAEDDFFTVRMAPRKALLALGSSVKTSALRSAFIDTLTLGLLSSPLRHFQLSTGTDLQHGFTSIALLAPEDVPAWRAQYDQFCRERPLQCRKLHGDADRTSSAQLAFNFRHFPLFVSRKQPQPDACAAVLESEAECLLGPIQSGSLGGDVINRALAMSDAANNLRKQIAQLDRHENDPRVFVQNWTQVHAHKVARARARLLNDLERIVKDRRTLVQGSEQLKALWQQGHGWPTGPEALREVAARLALVGYLMGEMPLLSCNSSRDYTRQLDTEVKLLATFADRGGGRLPSTPLNTPEWDRVRDDLKFSSSSQRRR